MWFYSPFFFHFFTAFPFASALKSCHISVWRWESKITNLLNKFSWLCLCRADGGSHGLKKCQETNLQSGDVQHNWPLLGAPYPQVAWPTLPSRTASCGITLICGAGKLVKRGRPGRCSQLNQAAPVQSGAQQSRDSHLILFLSFFFTKKVWFCSFSGFLHASIALCLQILQQF